MKKKSLDSSQWSTISVANCFRRARLVNVRLFTPEEVRFLLIFKRLLHTPTYSRRYAYKDLKGVYRNHFLTNRRYRKFVHTRLRLGKKMDLNIFTIDVYLNFDQTEDFRACYSFLNKSILIHCICTYKSFNLDLFET